MVRDSIVIEWHDIARGRHSAALNADGSIALGHAHDDGMAHPKKLAVLHLDGDPAIEEYMPPSELRDIVAINVEGARPIPVMFGHGDPTSEGHVTFFAQMKDGQPLPFAMVTPQDAPTMKVGETRIWEVNNLTGGDHNFHTHGFHFQLIETEFLDMDTPENNKVVPAPYLEDKDTIHLPRRTGAKGRSRTVSRLAVRFSDAGREGQILASGRTPTVDKSGGWLFHCHILEHSAMGMMSFFQIVDAATSVEGAMIALPEQAQLFQNYPNPFNPQTNILFSLRKESDVVVKIYNLLGQEIRSLLDRKFEAGFHRVQWDGKDESGAGVSSGVYFYQLRAGSFSDVKRMSLVR